VAVCAYYRDDDPPEDRQVVVVERPEMFNPASELEMPDRGLVIEVVEPKVPLDRAREFIRHYNAAAKRDSGRTWAAVAAEEAVPGKEVRLTTLSGGEGG